MYRYKVFRQQSDHTFVEIAQTIYLTDAEAVYSLCEFGVIGELDGEILQTKLRPTDQLTLI
jgi:hypothetical protein